jgi:membrane protease YdiL (CAAX protease family)
MFTNLSKTTQGAVFYVLALLLAAVCAFVPGLVAVYMFSPALAVLIMMLVITREGYTRAGWRSLGLTRLGLRSWPAALLIPILVLGVGYTLLWSFGLVQTIMPVGEVKWLNTFLFFIGFVVSNTLSFSLGEEIGWRGYLQPRLVGAYGRLRAYLLVGFGWAVWHYPLIFTGQYHTEGSVWVNTLLFTLTVIAVAVVIGEIYEQQHSVWAASLFHSSHNVIWSILQSFSVPSILLAYLGGESGVIPLVLYSVVALVLLMRHRGQTESPAGTLAQRAVP